MLMFLQQKSCDYLVKMSKIGLKTVVLQQKTAFFEQKQNSRLSYNSLIFSMFCHPTGVGCVWK